MQEKTIYITEKDQVRLCKLAMYRDLFPEKDQKILRKLIYDVSRGRVVKDGKDIPKGIVAIHSRVELKEIIWNKEFSIEIVFPEDIHGKGNRVSVLSPMGISLIGAKTGSLVECREPRELYKFIVRNTVPMEGTRFPWKPFRNQREQRRK